MQVKYARFFSGSAVQPNQLTKGHGTLFIISGPSGAGKSTLIEKLLLQIKNLKRIVSYTTREKRPGEEEGVNYHYVTKDEFEQRLSNKEFLEYFSFNNNYYGALKKDFTDQLSAGLDIVLDMDYCELTHVKAEIPNCISIFIMPESIESLQSRLEKRGDKRQAIESRMSAAQDIIKHHYMYDHLVVNVDGKIDEAFEQTKSIILSNRTRVYRQEIACAAVLQNHSQPFVFAAISSIPYFEGVSLAKMQLTPLVGWANDSFKIQLPEGKAYALRVPRKANLTFVDPLHEKRNLAIISELGIYTYVHYLGDDRTLLAEYIPNNGTLTPALLQQDSSYITKAISILKTLHGSKKLFANDINMRTKVEAGIQYLKGAKVTLPEDIDSVYGTMSEIWRKLEETCGEKVCCHNDPTPYNFVVSQTGELKLVDWEYSGLHDEFWDWANFSTQALLSEEQDKEMLIAYKGAASDEDLQRLNSYKPLVEFWLSIWIKFQISTGNKGVKLSDLESAFEYRYNRARDLLGCCLSIDQSAKHSSDQLAGHTSALAPLVI